MFGFLLNRLNWSRLQMSRCLVTLTHCLFCEFGAKKSGYLVEITFVWHVIFFGCFYVIGALNHNYFDLLT
jgi:hypothetical protein